MTWPPRTYDIETDSDLDEREQPNIGWRVLSPCCGDRVWPGEMIYCSGLPTELVDGLDWVCQGCVNSWILTGKVVDGSPLTLLKWMEINGATSGQLADWDAKNDTANDPLHGLDETEAAAVIAKYQSDFLARVDEAAETARAAYLTPGSGQALEYAQAEAEARAHATVVADGGTPDAADYPMLAYEATARSVSLADVVAEVIAAADAAVVAGAMIRVKRLAAKAAIRAAATIADIKAAADIDWAGD